MFEKATKSVITLPYQDTDFEFQVKLEAGVFSGVNIGLVLYPVNGIIPLENPSPIGLDGYIPKLFSVYEVSNDLTEDSFITMKLDVTLLHNLETGLDEEEPFMGRLYGEIVLVDAISNERLEAIEPAVFDVVRYLNI